MKRSRVGAMMLAASVMTGTALAATAPAPATPQTPAPLHPTRPPGWDPIGTDGQGSRWMLYQGLKDAKGEGVYQVRLDVLPAADNQAYKDAGITGSRYLANVDCGAGTIQFVSLTASASDGHQEHYDFPPETPAEKPSADSVMLKLFPMVCK